MRIAYGPGYRVYYVQRGAEIVILLCGGDKRTQRQDIKRAQALGFTLEEVASLLQLDGAGRCADTRELAAHKVALIERKLLDLAAMRDALSALVHQCETGQADGLCPIISILARDE